MSALREWRLDTWWVGGIAAISVAAGLLAVADPRVGVLVAIAAPALLLISSTVGSFAAVLGGGVLVFGASDSITLAKIVYLALLAAGVLAGLMRRRALGATRGGYPLALVSAGCCMFWVVDGGISVSRGTSGTSALRDLLPYILLLLVPLLGWQAGLVAEAATLERLFVVISGTAAASFMVAWIGRRNLGSLPITHLFLPSAALALAGVCYGVVMAARDGSHERRLWWSVFAATSALFLLITGNRSSLALIAVLPVVATIKQRRTSRRAMLLALAAIAAFVVVIGVRLGGEVAGINTRAVTSRLTSISSILQGGHDQSLAERTIETQAALRVFYRHPLSGSGPGTPYVWRDPFGNTHATFTLDTGLLLLAKWGVLGTLLILMLGAKIYRAADDVNSNISAAGETLQLFLWLSLLGLVFGVPPEDKGFAFAVGMLLSLVTAERHNASIAQLDGVTPVLRPGG